MRKQPILLTTPELEVLVRSLERTTDEKWPITEKEHEDLYNRLKRIHEIAKDLEPVTS